MNVLIRLFYLILFVFICLTIGLIRQNLWLNNQIETFKKHEFQVKTLKSNHLNVESLDINCISFERLAEKISFDLNETGFPFNIVPNIVHYILFDIQEISFSHFISILSVLKNQMPDRIYIHCNCHQLKGQYYRRLTRILSKTKTQLIIRTIQKTTEIFGQKLNEKWINWHLSDITRNRILQAFGGIYLDRDVYVVQSLDVFRKYEMTLNWDENQLLGTQTLIAHKNSRFLKLWLDSYHHYKNDSWYYNAGQLPTESILYKKPELVHRVKEKFGADGPKVCPLVYKVYYPKWSQHFYTIHLILRENEITYKYWCFRNYKREEWPTIVRFDEHIIKGLNVTFGEMTRILFNFENSLIH